MASKLTFRPRRAARQQPRYPTWGSSRREFLRALGGAAAGGALGALVGCDERPVPLALSLKDGAGGADAPRTPRDIGIESGPDFSRVDDVGPDVPAPKDLAPKDLQTPEAAPDILLPDITPPPDLPGNPPDMTAPKDLQLEGCTVGPDLTAGTPDAPVTPKDLWPYPNDTAGLPPPPDVPWPPTPDAGGPVPPNVPWPPPKDSGGGKGGQ